MGRNSIFIRVMLFILVSASMNSHALENEPITPKGEDNCSDCTLLKEIEKQTTKQQKNSDQDSEMLEKLLQESTDPSGSSHSKPGTTYRRRGYPIDNVKSVEPVQ